MVSVEHQPLILEASTEKRMFISLLSWMFFEVRTLRLSIRLVYLSKVVLGRGRERGGKALKGCRAGDGIFFYIRLFLRQRCLGCVRLTWGVAGCLAIRLSPSYHPLTISSLLASLHSLLLRTRQSGSCPLILDMGFHCVSTSLFLSFLPRPLGS